MQKSLMVGLNEKDMEAVIRTYDLKDYYYPTINDFCISVCF